MTENPVYGSSVNGYGVHGNSTNAVGVLGDTGSPYYAIWGNNWGIGNGILGSVDGSGTAVFGRSELGTGVLGWSGGNYAVQAISRDWRAILASTNNATQPCLEVRTPAGAGLAAFFDGNVSTSRDLHVVRNLSVTGFKSFKIDHPLDPQNKYLLHNSVESSEMKNVYDGVAELDDNGEAWVDLDEWFEALNKDFRYQLTAVGGAAPSLHVAEEIDGNRFKIAGGEGGMKVCWQVTGTRKDPWAAANPFEVEQEKPPEERGHYLQADIYGAPESQKVMPAPPREEPQAPELPTMPPGVGAPPGFGPQQALEAAQRQQIDELRQQVEELRQELRRKR
jgi:hypothetical protein